MTEPTARQVGIKDVAARAGVSVGTVSNVLNHPGAVSQERRRAVESAIRELGYVPNHAARQLKVGLATMHGLVIVEACNPYYGTIGLGAEQAAARAGLGLFSASSEQNAEREADYLHRFEQQRARGILLAPVGIELQTAREVADRGTPVVLLDADDPHFCRVGVDDYVGGRLAAQHLIDLGRRRIAVVGEPSRHPQVVRRHYGALAAAEERPRVRIDFLSTRDMTILEGRRIGELLAARPRTERPDALFATNDLLAIGLLQALTMARTFRIPEDIAIIGYDDIDFCTNAVVALSSVAQPAPRIGATGVELVEEELEETVGHEHRRVLLPPTLMARASTLGE